MRVLLLLALGLPAAPQKDARIEGLLKAIRFAPDQAKKEQFEDLARPGDAASFEALVTVLGWLHAERTIEAAYESLRHFRRDPGLAERAVELLTDAVLRGPKEARDQAVDVLRYFGQAAQPGFVRILEESKEEEHRDSAIWYALDGLLARGDEQALRLVLAHADPAAIAERPQPWRAFDADMARPHLLGKLQDRRTSVGWILVLIPALHADPGDDVIAALVALLRHRSTVPQLAALEELVVRGEEAQARVQLERMRLSAAPQVKVGVVRIQTRLARGDPEWRATLAALAGAPEPSDRIAAAVGLGVLGDADARQRLERLLGDRSWKVRHAVLGVARELRDPALLGPLVARLGQEDGALRVAVGDTLTELTGLELGASDAAWTQWYAEQGATFVLPSRAELAARAAQRASARVADASEASFYGLPVRSKNLCFAIDVSGSMRASVGGGRTRHDVACAELAALLARLPQEARCNLVFFDDEIASWQKRLTPMDAKAVASAQAFVAERVTRGGTNIHGALVAAFADDAVDTVYLLSDGDPSSGTIVDPLELRAELGQWNSVARVTVHCVSVGQRSQLLADLARDSGGRYLEIGVEAAEER